MNRTMDIESGTEGFRVHVVVEDCHVTSVRRNFTSWLSGHGASATDLVDWGLIVSELVANACTASPPGTSIDIEASRREERTVLRIRNRAAEAFLPRVPAAVAPDRLSGRGMLIADRLADGLAFDVGEQVTVTCWKINGLPAHV
jgi:anti-sigma regulatory factor (Ser/Thr protein kinase)